MRIFCFLMIVLFSPMVYGGQGDGKITKIAVHEKGDGLGVVMFSTENNSGKASCSTAYGGAEWAFGADTEQGKAMYSLLLTAAASGRDIVVEGKGDCLDWFDRERPRFIKIHY
jgi:hypothetical protein